MSVTFNSFGNDEVTVKAEGGGGGKYYARLRGLPYNSRKDDIAQFLHPIELANLEKDVMFITGRNGKAGEAYVRLRSEEDLNQALAKNKESIGTRYIEVFTAKAQEVEEYLPMSDNVVKLRGLPYGVKTEEIRTFLEGCEEIDIICMVKSYDGKLTGEAFIQFNGEGDVTTALSKHKNNIGQRYVEVFRSSCAEMRKHMQTGADEPYDPYGYGRGYGQQYSGAPTHYDYDSYGYQGYQGGRGGGAYRGYSHYGASSSYGSGSYGGGRGRGSPAGRGGGGRGYMGMGMGGGAAPGSYHGGYGDNGYGSSGYGGSDVPNMHTVRMRGIPFSVTDNDIHEFFAGCDVIEISYAYNRDNKLSGECEVAFRTHGDALKAMKKDRELIGSRYIELFVNSKPKAAAYPPTY